MSVCTCLSKFGLVIINILFSVIGAGVIVLGAFMFREYVRYGDAGTDYSFVVALLPAFVLVIVGIMAITLGAIGCCATFNGSKCVTGLYFILLLLLLLGLVTGTVVSTVYHGKIDDGLHEALKTSLNDYSNNSMIKAQVDFMQSEFRCCGVDKPLDWGVTPWCKSQTLPLVFCHPESCCVDQKCTYPPVPYDPRLYNKGCYTSVKKAIQDHLVVIASVTGGFAILLVLGMLLSCVLLVHKRKHREVPYMGLPSQPHDVRI